MPSRDACLPSSPLGAMLGSLTQRRRPPVASDQEFVDYICEQIALGERISYRRMFGEYALYCDGKVVALITDNRLFIKMTPEGRAWAAGLAEGPPFQGAKAWLMPGTELEERGWLTEMVRITERALPPPKPKRKKAPWHEA